MSLQNHMIAAHVEHCQSSIYSFRQLYFAPARIMVDRNAVRYIEANSFCPKGLVFSEEVRSFSCSLDDEIYETLTGRLCSLHLESVALRFEHRRNLFRGIHISCYSSGVTATGSLLTSIYSTMIKTCGPLHQHNIFFSSSPCESSLHMLRPACIALKR
jgi:hypothetical protein